MRIQVPSPEGRDGGPKGLVILYEDNHIIAVVKPSGILSQGDRTGENSIYDMVKDYIRVKKGKVSLLGNARPVRNSEGSQRRVSNGVFLGLVHRLDKPVSGIILFAKTSKGAARLSEQFRSHAIQKTYHGIVLGRPNETRGEIKEKVKKISFFAQGFTGKSDEELLKEIKKATKTRTAELLYEVIKSNDSYSLLKVMPKTGRFHQIRIQMANMGHPVLGDVKYGAPNQLPDKSIALCATNLSFKTATGGKMINLRIDLPKDWEEYIRPVA